MANRVVSVLLQAEIGQYVAGMTKAAAATKGVGESAERNARQANRGFDLAGRGAVLFGAAAAGALVGVVTKSMAFEKAMSGVQAATQASASSLEDLRDAAMRAGADTQYSATEAAAAITEMAKAGVSAKDIMGGGLDGALALAAAGQMEVAEAAGIASTAMTQFSLAGEDLPHVADLLAAGAGKAMGEVSDLGMALNQAGLIASAAGLSIEETTGTLSAFASAGLIGSDAGTSFKTMLQQLQNPAEESAALLEQYGITLYDASGQFVGMSSLAGQLRDAFGSLTPAVRDQAMAQIFGSDAVRAANVLYAQGAEGIAEWTTKVNDAGYAQEQAAALTDNLAGDLERLGGSFDTLLISLGGLVQGPLRGLTQMLGGLLDLVGSAVEAFTDLPGPVQATVIAVGALVLLRNPLASILTTLAEKSVMGAVGLLDIAQNADKARGGLANMALAATEAAVAFAFGKAVNDVVEFTNAGEDAREVIDSINEGLEGLEGPAQIDATKTAIEQLKKELAESKAILDEYAAYNGVEWAIWGQFVMDADEVANAKDEVRLYEEAIARLQEESVLAAGAVPLVGEAITLVGQQAQVSQELWQEWLDKVAESNGTFAGALSIYQGLLDQKTEAERAQAQATADATADSSDSWEDHVDSVEVSLGELAAALQTNIDNQMNWRTNLGLIAQWAGQDVANYLMEMGEGGIDIVAAMADGTSAEARAMRDQIVRQVQLMGEESTGDFANYMRIMETMGSEGGKRTVQGLAYQLGLGVDEVRRISGQYGLNLAEGVNPLLAALGKAQVRPGNGPNWATYADGGYTGDGGKWDPAGIVHKGEYVVTKERTARLGVRNLENLERIMPGYAGGGFVSGTDVPRPPSTAPYRTPISTAGDETMNRAYGDTVDWVNANSAPPIASGSPGQWQAMFAAVQRQFPGVVLHSGFRPGSITATGNLSYHASGRAIDITPSMDIFNWLASNYRNSRELIFSPAGIRQIWNGQPHYYSEPTRGDHWDHIHWAMANGGVIDEPVIGRGMWSGGSYSFGETGPETVLPGIRSREFGAGGSSQGSGGTVVVSIDGARIVGTLMVNGLEAQMDGRIVQAMSSVNSRLSASGVRG